MRSSADTARRPVNVVVDSELRLRVAALPEPLLEQIVSDLTIPNRAREEAERRNQWGWQDLPESIELYHERFDDANEDWLDMPRGYAKWLKELLYAHDYRPRWVDRRQWQPGPEFGPAEFTYLVHQPECISSIIREQQGILKSPTGSGKTVIALGLIWEKHPAKSIILVDRINLVNQVVKRAREHFGVEVGVIGEGAWDEDHQIVVATVQTLWSKKLELLTNGFFDKWSVVILDECHHVTAEMYNGLVSLFSARYRFGLSATPDKTGDFELALCVLGDVFHEVPYEILEQLGIIMKPHVEVKETPFSFVYWPDHRVERNKKTGKVPECEVPGCKKSGKTPHGHRNNYQKLKEAIVEDYERNVMIANNIIELSGQGHHQLVISDQTGHLDAIGMHLLDRGLADKIFQLTGKLKGTPRERMIEEIEASAECVILSTIAGEALDIPVIDVVHLVWPTRNARKTEQNIGRGGRTHKDKVKAVVYDYADFNVNVLAGQFSSRLKGCYRELGLEVKGLKKKASKQGSLGRGLL